MKWCFYVSQSTFCFTKTQWSFQSINPGFSPLDHRDVAWEIPMQNNSAFWHQQHCYYPLKVFFYTIVGPHRSHLLMKAGNNILGTRPADFVMCIKSMELGQAHTKQEGTYARADTHIARRHTHAPHTQLYTLTAESFVRYSRATSLPTGIYMFSSLYTCSTKKMMVLLQCFHHCLHASPRKICSYFTAFCTS